MSRPGSTTRWKVSSYRSGEWKNRDDFLATEEPLEIRISPAGLPGVSLSVTMRTPGSDFELAAGFLFSEGILKTPEQIRQIAYCREVGRADQQYNVMTVETRPGMAFELDENGRRFGMTAACGVCGKATLEALHRSGLTVIEDEMQFPIPTLLGLPSKVREAQSLFEKTGGIHAAALFNAEGKLLTLREDIGRHNAVDKVIGERFLAGKLPLSVHVMFVSGRPGFEIVQKALAAGIPMLAGVSAPSSLAVELAQQFGMTLVGFLREDRFNVYSGKERLQDVFSPVRAVSVPEPAAIPED